MGAHPCGEGFKPNGFGGSDRSQRLGLHDLVSAAGAAAGLAIPVLGIVYGVIRVGYEEYYRGLGLTPETVGLGQAAIVSRVAVIVGTLAAVVATWTSFGVIVYRLVAPFRAGQADADRSAGDWFRLALAYVAALGVVAVPVVIAKWVAGGRGLAFWASGAVPAGVISLQLSWALADTELRVRDRLRRATRSAYIGAVPRLGLLLSLTLMGGSLTALIFNFWNDTAGAGRVVRSTGRLPISHLNVTVSPARVISKGTDPVGVCNGSRKAVLVGRHDGQSFVLLIPSDASDPTSEVVPLSDVDYAVAATTGDPQPCHPKVP